MVRSNPCLRTFHSNPRATQIPPPTQYAGISPRRGDVISLTCKIRTMEGSNSPSNPLTFSSHDRPPRTNSLSQSGCGCRCRARGENSACLQPFSNFAHGHSTDSSTPLHQNHPEDRPMGRVKDSYVVRHVKVPHSVDLTGCLYQETGMRPEGSGPQVLQLVVEPSLQTERKPSNFRFGPRVILDRVQAQRPSLRRISSAGTPFTRPARMSETRCLSSAITRGG